MEENNSKKKTVIFYVVAYIIAALIGFATYYFALPPMNVHSFGFWGFLAWCGLIGILPLYIFKLKDANGDTELKDFFKKLIHTGFKKNKRKKKKKSGDIEVKDKTEQG